MTHRQLCLDMLATLDCLGDSPTARIDAREWHRHYARKLARIGKPKKPHANLRNRPTHGYDVKQTQQPYAHPASIP